jgi:hypothetical protein
MPTYQQLPHVIAFLLLLARLGDVGSTVFGTMTILVVTVCSSEQRGRALE